MKKNKKGFTLIELMAVVIILIVIIFIAVRLIGDKVKDTETKTIIANAGAYIKAVNSFVEVESIGNSSYKNNIFYVSDLEEHVKISGTKPDNGILVIVNRQVYSGCLEYGGYYINFVEGNVSNPEKGVCDTSLATFNFSYTGHEEIFKASVSGEYKLEVWGAQGGNIDATYTGGNGGYSVGYIHLNSGDQLYINVGGAGTKANPGTASGGYNGGGGGYAANYSVSSGGGATSIATKSGLLSSLNSDIDSVIIVAGGGGGTYYQSSTYNGVGGHGGGYTGVSGTTSNSSYMNGTGGTQTTGGTAGDSSRGTAASFGQGGTGNNYSSGGGGGFYGGGLGNNSGAGGGSGYIGNSNLYNRVMYCYNCTESNGNAVKTKIATCVEENPTSQCAKKGSGYAKITYVGNQIDDPYHPSHLTIYYDNGVANGTLSNSCDICSDASFLEDKIVLGTGYYGAFYTEAIDLSLYNSVIFKRTNGITDRIYFAQTPQYANNIGEAFNVITAGTQELGNNYYVTDISNYTRADLHFTMNHYYSTGSGEVYYVAFSTKTVSEIVDDHSFLP